MQPRLHHQEQRSASVGPPTSMYLLECQVAQLEVARMLEWLSVADPSLERTARAAFWVASRIRGDRLALP